jgi:2-methylisocitrate lyase-like PEP mutase family enzyme
MGIREDKARRFAALHRRDDPLVLFNVWDAGSARIVAAAGAQAIATGSWSVAASHGADDGEMLAFELVLANVARVVDAVPLPVTVDFEGAYAVEPAEAGANAAALAATGAVGCNVEDRVIGGEGLHPLDLQCARIEAIRRATPDGFFINARTDLFLGAAQTDHQARVGDALERARAFAAAGADGLFVPGLREPGPIAEICADSPLPVNIMVSPGTPPLERLAALGAARISHAGAPWRVAMQALAEAAAVAHRREG